MNLLENTTTRKQTYVNKKAEVFKNAESLFEAQKLIYTGFMDNLFSRSDEFSTPKQETTRDKVPDFEIRKKFEETPRDIIPDLETEESAEQRRKHKGQGLKILAPQQMPSRLPIFLAQLKAGNNSEKLKNEIRQLLYSLYRSKKLTKKIYKHLINAN